jgi:hypothetical protein
MIHSLESSYTIKNNRKKRINFKQLYLFSFAEKVLTSRGMKVIASLPLRIPDVAPIGETPCWTLNFLNRIDELMEGKRKNWG